MLRAPCHDLPSDEATFLLEMLWLSGEKPLFPHIPSPNTHLKRKKAEDSSGTGLLVILNSAGCCRLVPTAPRVLTVPRHPEIVQDATVADVGVCWGALTWSRVVCVTKGRLFCRWDLPH